MRSGVVLLVLAVAVPAYADKKIQDLIPGYERESTACATQTAGMLKVATGVATLAKSAPDAERPELEKAAAALAKGHAQFADYCTELGGLVGYLKDNEAAAYKTVEREIDTRAGKVSRLRRDAKRLAEELGPLTRKMIPRIMKLPTAAPEPEKRLQVKFPSGRAVALPVLSGSWKTSGTAHSDVAEYEDKKVTATISTRQLAGDCGDHRTTIPAKEASELDVKRDTVAWATRYVRKEQSGAHLVMMACAPRRDGAVLVAIDIAPDTAAIGDAMLQVGLAMLAAHDLKP